MKQRRAAREESALASQDTAYSLTRDVSAAYGPGNYFRPRVNLMSLTRMLRGLNK